MQYLAIFLVLLGGGCSRPSVPPTVSVSATPASVKPGQCATLTWSSTNSSSVSIDQQVGKVDPSGSQQVCPGMTTQYTVTAAGDGGSTTATTTITMIPLAVEVVTFSEAALLEFGKAELKPKGSAKIKEYREQAQDQLRRAHMVVITGYTDNVGGPDFNSALSLQRAEAVRDALISLGADPSKFQIKGAGEAMPIADNSTDEGRARNRRVEVQVEGLGQ
jgi:OOP family OmpA-OmpF porin